MNKLITQAKRKCKCACNLLSITELTNLINLERATMVFSFDTRLVLKLNIMS